jgi:hypothetical protein
MSENYRRTVEQYDRMIRAGVLADCDPVELLDGVLVFKDRSDRGGDRNRVGNGHSRGVDLMQETLYAIRPLGCYLRCQQPIRLTESEPEPDGAVVAGKPGDYHSHPSASDVICVIEVSHGSLQHDLTMKLAIYAGAGIPHYLVVNLVDDVVIEPRDPSPAHRTYAPSKVHHPGDTITIDAPDGPFVVNVADLLA